MFAPTLFQNLNLCGPLLCPRSLWHTHNRHTQHTKHTHTHPFFKLNSNVMPLSFTAALFYFKLGLYHFLVLDMNFLALVRHFYVLVLSCFHITTIV